MRYLIAGLGNVGAEYAHTRHNAGFMVLDALAGASFTVGRYGDVAELKVKGHTLLLLKPSTYMNLSGKAVRYWLDKEKILVENLLVVVDDIALPLGTLRLRARGSDGGHNGLKDINAVLGTDAYARLRVGIGGDFPRGMQIDHVLGQFTADELTALAPRLDVAGEIIRSFALQGLDRTMNTYNKR